MAQVALEAKREGKPAEDCVGRPLLYANELAERTGTKRLESWARGAKSLTLTMDVDLTGPKAAQWPK